MPTPSHQTLLSPGRIGSLELRNRIVVTAMGVNFGEDDGRSGDRVVAYHEEQARGGAGLIISGACGVMYPIGQVQQWQIAISEDAHIPGLARVVDAVHRHGCRFAVQLHQGGLNAVDDTAAGRPQWCPSEPEKMQGDFADGFLLPELEGLIRVGMPTEYRVMTKEDIRTPTVLTHGTHEAPKSILKLCLRQGIKRMCGPNDVKGPRLTFEVLQFRLVLFARLKRRRQGLARFTDGKRRRIKQGIVDRPYRSGANSRIANQCSREFSRSASDIEQPQPPGPCFGLSRFEPLFPVLSFREVGIVHGRKRVEILHLPAPGFAPVIKAALECIRRSYGVSHRYRPPAPSTPD